MKHDYERRFNTYRYRRGTFRFGADGQIVDVEAHRTIRGSEYDIHGFREEYQGADCRIRLRDPKGGNMDEWPEDLRVREMPK